MRASSHRLLRGLAIAAAGLAPVTAGAAAVAPASPYAGLEARPVKALSAERRAGLLAGAGLSYALAAELNGHPGPKHVLELADELALSVEQRAAVAASFERMRADAAWLGAAIVASEELLDRRFAHRHLDEATLSQLTSKIGAREGELRFVHLRAHLETDALLSAEQRARYSELRGYAAAGEDGELHRGHDATPSVPGNGAP